MSSRATATSHAAWLLAALALARPAISRPAPAPPFECHAAVGFDLNLTLPGYILPTKAGARLVFPSPRPPVFR